MKLYDCTNVDEVPWSDAPWDEPGRRYLVPLVRDGLAPYFSDTAEMQIAEIDDIRTPIVIADYVDGNSNNISIHARYIGIVLHSLDRLAWHPVLDVAARGVLNALGLLLRSCDIDRCVHVGNWAPLRGGEPELDGSQVVRLTRFLTERFPEHALVFSAVNPTTHHELLNNLANAGYEFMYAGYTRMLLPENLPRGARDVWRRDAALLDGTDYQILDGRDVVAAHTAPRLAELYAAINRKKYATNPAISEEFFARALRDDALTFRILRARGRIDAFVAYAVMNDVLCPPFFGYDLSVPQSVGLYRMVQVLLMREACRLGVALETGAGADVFKSRRGDRPFPRYTAYHTAHLAPGRRLGWRVLASYANRVYAPNVRSYLQSIDGDRAAGVDVVPEVFRPPMMSPRATSSALRRALPEIERDLARAAELHGRELVEAVASLQERLAAWPKSHTLLVEPRLHLAKLQERVRAQRKRREAEELSSVVANADDHLDNSFVAGGITVVVSDAGHASSRQLRVLAEELYEHREVGIVVLASVPRPGKVLIFACVAPSLRTRGIDVRAVVTAAAAAVGGEGGGQPEQSWGGGRDTDRIDRALAIARQELIEYLESNALLQ